MSDAIDTGSLDRWSALVQSPPFQEALAVTGDGMVGLDGSLRALAESEETEDAQYLARLLATVASYWPQPDNFQDPYGPFLAMADGRRSPIPADLSVSDLEALSGTAEAVPHLVFRSRIHDVLAITGERARRPGLHRLQVQALVAHGFDAESLVHDSEQWERGITVATRFGSALQAERDALVQMLVTAMQTEGDDHSVFTIARLLRTHKLARTSAGEVAAKLLQLRGTPNVHAQQEVLREAAEWFRLAGDSDAAEETLFRMVQDLIAEADAAVARGGRGALAATSVLERALQTLRTISRSARRRLGAESLPELLAGRIREAGAAAIGEMHAFEISSGDISTQVAEVSRTVEGLEPVDALRALAALSSFANASSMEDESRAAIEQSAFLSLVSNRLLSTDGRTIHRTSEGEEFYGLPGAVWRHMSQAYDLRVNLLGAVVIPRAWIAITQEHHLRVEDFLQIARGSSIIPPNHEELFSQGLHLGYTGSFGPAAHVLVPQFEAIVRFHLSNSGQRTSVIDGDGRENEVGLTALMQNDVVTDIFGPDIAFELRALLCGPFGSNLRNEIAHGIVDDDSSLSASSVYVWWLAHKVAFIPFWNALHDASAAEAREPAQPGTSASATEPTSSTSP